MKRLLRDLLARAIARLDQSMFNDWAETPNGCTRLVAIHDAVLDADHTMQMIENALADGDYAEAGALLKMGRESLAERITELKELL